jgi:tripartite-type tricarboxylate transporter receptor subunit TctC
MSMRAARSRLVATAIAILAVSVCACTQSSGADTWPARPVRLIVPYAAGSGIDLAARLYAPLLAERWQRSVVVDNRPGGTGLRAYRRSWAGTIDTLCCLRRLGS